MPARTGLTSCPAEAKAIDAIHGTQRLNYLKATALHLCLLLNFGKRRLEIKRIVLAL
jgi:GxxExxY protein